MKNLWSEILVPAVIAGLTVLGTVGVESARTVRPGTRVRLLREVRLDTLRRDTVPQDTGKKAAADLLLHIGAEDGLAAYPCRHSVLPRLCRGGGGSP